MRTPDSIRFGRWAQLLSLLFAIAMLLVERVAWAQQTASNVAQNISSGRSYYFEIALVVVLFGAALYAVCRSSFRR